MMVPGKLDGQGGGAYIGELLGGDGAVIPIVPETARQAEPGPDHQGGGYSCQHSEPGVALAYVVQQRGHDHLGIFGPEGGDVAGGLHTVSLIGHGLGEEALARDRAEQGTNEAPLPLAEGPGSYGGEKSPSQVGETGARFRLSSSTCS